MKLPVLFVSETIRRFHPIRSSYLMKWWYAGKEMYVICFGNKQVAVYLKNAGKIVPATGGSEKKSF